MKQLTVTKNDAGQRVDRFLQKAMPLLPDSLLQKYLRLGRVKRGKTAMRRDDRVILGDVLSIYVNDEFFDRPTEKNAYLAVASPRLDILFEDENILLLNKPVGMLCIPGGDDNSGKSSVNDRANAVNTLVTNLQAYAYQSGEWSPKNENSFAPALCNRIDRNTGGIVVAAKNAQALRIINEKIKNREIDKYYLCAVYGSVTPKAGTLSGYIFKDSKLNRVYVSDKSSPGSKTAVTEYKTLAEKDGLSLLECRLLTGRTHQIRAQLAAAGHPLLGDGKYGKPLSQSEKNASLPKHKPSAAYLSEKSQALWSYKLKFGFKTPAGALEYLKNREFIVPNVEFCEKYFQFRHTH